MEILEKEIGSRRVRMVFFDKHGYSSDYFLQLMIKKNIYFDYLITTARDYSYYRNSEREIFTNTFIKLDKDKWMGERKYFSYETIIENYENSKEYQLHKREQKLKRIINE